MTRPINLYAVSRIHEESAFNIIERHQSQREDRPRTQRHEIESLCRLVDALMEKGMTLEELDGFFFGFHIPQIGKEFDLLKFTEKSCLNIELKSQAVPQEQIHSQLLKNRHYLSHLGTRLNLYTVVTDTLTCYKLSVQGTLLPVSLEEVAQVAKRHREQYIENIDALFRASEYLVSPLSTPKKFIQGEYFLTQAQDQIRMEVLKGVEETDKWSFFHITGRPGTGKTLLIYDIAKTLARYGKTVIAHCGAISPEQEMISRDIENLRILSSENVREGKKALEECSFILVDEAHRMQEYQFRAICDSVWSNDQSCIFSSDPEQVLTTVERERDIAGKIRKLPLKGEFVLSEKLRYNKEMHSFISRLKHPDFVPDTPVNYLNVDINYANDPEEARRLLAYYRNREYVFINYSRNGEEHSRYADMENDFDATRVIGMEFNRVVMLMDSSFYYDEEGVLQGIPSPDPDILYPNLFYQGITRVREKLALVVVEAPELFNRISTIVS